MRVLARLWVRKRSCALYGRLLASSSTLYAGDEYDLPRLAHSTQRSQPTTPKQVSCLSTKNKGGSSVTVTVSLAFSLRRT